MKINPINGNPSEQMNSLEERYPFSRNDQISSSQEEVDESELFFPRVFSRAINHCFDSVGNFFSILLLPLELTLELKNRINQRNDEVKGMRDKNERVVREFNETNYQRLEQLEELFKNHHEMYLVALKRYQERKDEKTKIWLQNAYKTAQGFEKTRQDIEEAIHREKIKFEKDALYKKYRYNG